MTGAEFLKRALATVDDLALLYANTPVEAAEHSLAEFGERVREGWRRALLPWLGPHDIDTVVDDVIARVRIRRREIERVSAGGVISERSNTQWQNHWRFATMNAPARVVYLKPLESELESEPIMRFRLTYEGELRATQRDPVANQSDPLASHKHQIRRVFHKQLKTLWNENQFLRGYRRPTERSIDSRPIHISAAYFGEPDEVKIPLVDYIASCFPFGQYKFAPLVCEEFSLLCSIDILFLRRDIPGSAITAGDIDNRVKTLTDALSKPKNAQELAGNERPLEDETPFFCLLEDDKLISGFSVETDTLLDEVVPGDADRRKARTIITIEIKPYYPTFFNLAFS
jgi:hypothetical protein